MSEPFFEVSNFYGSFMIISVSSFGVTDVEDAGILQSCNPLSLNSRLAKPIYLLTYQIKYQGTSKVTLHNKIATALHYIWRRTL